MSEQVFCHEWVHCSSCDVDTTPLYTRDDLVRVAMDALQTYEVFSDAKLAAEFIVDRLTKTEEPR